MAKDINTIKVKLDFEQRQRANKIEEDLTEEGTQGLYASLLVYLQDENKRLLKDNNELRAERHRRR